MSTDDLLSRATRAMRETTEPEPDTAALGTDGAPARTLARLGRSTMASGTTKARRRTFTRWIVMPMAASFIVFAAWASASGRMSRWIASHEDNEHPTRPTPTAVAPLPEPAPPPAALPAPAPSAEPAVTVVPPAPTAALSIKKASAPVDTDALYRNAHDAHFVRKDSEAALVAWDRYIAAAGPTGRFTLEARYNRALCLARLRRRHEATEALRPFANGEYGGYRRDEAAELIQMLRVLD